MAEHTKIAGLDVFVREANQENMYKCNILFVTTEKENSLTDILAEPHNNVLIVFEGDNLLYFPVDISFKTVDTDAGTYLNYVVNSNSIKTKNFQISPEIIGYAKIK